MADNWQGALEGASGGASLGASTGNPYVTAGAAVIGGLVGLFGKSPEQEREERMKALREEYEKARRRAIMEGLKQIALNTRQGMSQARAGATRRLTALGRASEAESASLPLEEQYAEKGSKATEQFLYNINNSYDQAGLDISRDYANRPIAPGGGETIGTLAPEVGNAIGQERYLSAIENYYKQPTNTPSVNTPPQNITQKSYNPDFLGTVGSTYQPNKTLDDYIKDSRRQRMSLAIH